MTRRLWGNGSVVGLAGALACALLVGCDSGGSNDTAAGALRGASFVGLSVQPGPGGPGTSAPIPTVFLDQALEFEFDGPVDSTSFGGFAIDPATSLPRRYTGIPPVAGAAAIPYNPFLNQAAARASFEIRLNQLLGALIPSYIVGRHADRPNILVIDPVVNTLRAGQLGIATNVGFATSSVYTFRIPAGSGLSIGGRPAQSVGVSPLALPVPQGAFVAESPVNLTFQSGTSTGPNPNPPRLISISSSSGRNGSETEPIFANDSIILTFDNGVDPGSIDLLSNFTIRNRDLASRFVPGNLIINPIAPNIIEFAPIPSWGEGITSGLNMRGYDIEISVGTSFGGSSTVPPITGRPQGLSGTRIPMDPSTDQQVIFRTTFTPGAEVSLAVIDSFGADPVTGLTTEDAAFAVTLNRVQWNSAANPGVVTGPSISGSPLATFNGNPGALGTRTQRTVLTAAQLSAPPPVGLFAPFDSPPANILPMINPNGGSRLQQLLEAVDLGNPRSSLELIEWGPSTPTGGQQAPGPVFAATYPQFRAWCGISSLTAALLCPGGTNGMTPLYVANFDRAALQPVDPAMTNTNAGAPANAGGVLVSTGVTNYTTALGFTTYFPFPVFSPPFDYVGTGTGASSLIFDVNIEPGAAASNFNRFRATAFVPVRRNIGAPISSGVFTTARGGCETYDNRFTFVNIVADGRSQFLDTGATAGGNRFVGVQISPDPSAQPAGTRSIWRFEGANAIANPTTPVGATTGQLVYWDDVSPANQMSGMTRFPAVLGQLDGRRYFRFSMQFRNNNLTNQTQSYTSLIMAVVL